MRRGSLLAVITAMTLVSATAAAQPRDTSRAEAPLEIVLPSPVRFGDVVVPAHRYRLTLGPAGLALAEAESMLLAATVPVTEIETSDSVATPTVAVTTEGTKVVIVLRHLDRLYRAEGEKVEPVLPEGPKVELAAKHETLVEAALPESRTERQLVDRALRRYLVDVKHCADKAHRAHWKTDDPKFFRCVCPMTEKWRMPRVEHPIRVHRALAVGHHGFSFTVTPEGAVSDCRVWAGAEPPPEPVAVPPPATDTPPSASDAAAPVPPASPSPPSTP